MSCRWGSVCPGRTWPPNRENGSVMAVPYMPNVMILGWIQYCLPLRWPRSGSGPRRVVNGQEKPGQWLGFDVTS